MSLSEATTRAAIPRLASAPAARDNTALIVWLRGEHDAATVAELSDILARAIAVGDGDLIIDMCDVTFIATATIGVLVKTRDRLRFGSRSLSVRSPSPCARRMLEVCRLTDLIAPATLADAG